MKIDAFKSLNLMSSTSATAIKTLVGFDWSCQLSQSAMRDYALALSSGSGCVCAENYEPYHLLYPLQRRHVSHFLLW